MRLYPSLLACLLSAGAFAQAPVHCATRLLVSGYNSNNVHLYDGCDGSFLRVLDEAGRIQGAQATVIGPDNKLYVVSEGNGRILRYDANTLAFDGVAISLPTGFGATGMAIAGNEVYVSGYDYDGVKRYNLTSGAFIADAIAPGTAGLNGADNGMVFGPDGKLYVPGYDSSNVLRHDPATGQTSVFVAAGSGGLNAARGILFEPGGQTVLISSELGGEVIRYDVVTGAKLASVITALNRPTGMAFHPDGDLLVTTRNAVGKYDPQTGVLRRSAAAAAAGGANGLTFVTVLGDAASAPDARQIGSQYWITGTGRIEGRTLIVDDMVSTVGAAFGAQFDPEEIELRRWGQLRIVFTSCHEAQFSWESRGAESANFGSGGYPLIRLLPSELTERCLAQGFANASDLQWINGGWYGGEARGGEGLLIDKTSDGRAFVAWFTYRPR